MHYNNLNELKQLVEEGVKIATTDVVMISLNY